jgi:Protein of unknown function (DUF732)
MIKTLFLPPFLAVLIPIATLFGAAPAQADATGAAPAHADATGADPDAEFLAALDGRGITYPSAAYAIRAGHGVCRGIDLTPGGTIANAVMIVADDSQLPPADATYFVADAIAFYCPWDAPAGGSGVQTA